MNYNTTQETQMTITLSLEAASAENGFPLIASLVHSEV